MLRQIRQGAGRLVILVNILAAGGQLGLGGLTAQVTLPGTDPLEWSGDLSARMVEGIDRFLMHALDESVEDRQAYWQVDFSSLERYRASIQPLRQRFLEIIGAVDPRLDDPAFASTSTLGEDALLARGAGYTVQAVRWPVFEGVYGEGLLLRPESGSKAMAIVLPDADQTPEQVVGLVPGLPHASQLAQRLAANGCLVVVPTLINRDDTWSGNARLGRFTNQPHREWIYRQAFELGRHIIGYEVQKVRQAIDCLAALPEAEGLPIGLYGYGEGGLIGFYAAAVDPRIQIAWISGYFDSRQRVWAEPIYRNVFGLLREFGDAEVVRLIAPRRVVVEYAEVPAVAGPPAPRENRMGAAPGRLTTPGYFAVESEVLRARNFFAGHDGFQDTIELVYGNEGLPVIPGSRRALRLFLQGLGIAREQVRYESNAPIPRHPVPDSSARQHRQVRELVDHTQRQLRLAEDRRAEFWNRQVTAANWPEESIPFRQQLWEDVIGKFPTPDMPAHPRTRRLEENDSWRLYEVVLDVWDDVFAWGYLLLPTDLAPGEQRPVVVCQHGLEGLPSDTVFRDAPGYRAYKAFAARLAERGFITFAPHNPYRGRDAFRVLQRKANPLGKSLFSIITGQHQRILDWLSVLPGVDPQRIGFYGLSYGGKTAMRVPALLDRYRLSICSADFNEWIWKNCLVSSPYCYLYTGEYEMPEWNLGNTFNYAEMAALIAPRPFMVERGHLDGVAPDEWVAYEYAKVRRFYARLGTPDRTEIEFFIGPHTINGVGTFNFLHRYLNWPAPE